MTEEEQVPQGISRRTMTKAAAWSVPVIALAAVAPSAAASVLSPLVLAFALTRDATRVFLEFRATRDGVPVPGVSIVFVLFGPSGGYGPARLPATNVDGRTEIAFLVSYYADSQGVYGQRLTASVNGVVLLAIGCPAGTACPTPALPPTADAIPYRP